MPVYEDPVVPRVILAEDLGAVVTNSPGTYEAEVTIDVDGRVKIWHTKTEPGDVDHGALDGLADDDHPQYALKSAAAFDTAAPTSAVAASSANHLTRKTEMDTALAAKQAAHALLTALAGLSAAADKLGYFSGATTMALTTLTSFARTLLDDADAATARTTLGLAALATKATIDSDTLLEDDVVTRRKILSECITADRLDPTDVEAFQTFLGLGALAYQATRTMTVPILCYNSALTWTNMPSAHTMLLGNTSSVRRVDLSSYSQCRLTAIQFGAAASGAKLRLRYAASGSNNPDSYSAISASELELSLGTGAGTNYVESSWVDLVSGAKGDKYVAVTGISGDGAADPAFFSILAEFR